jgi:hypothetical protein
MSHSSPNLIAPRRRLRLRKILKGMFLMVFVATLCIIVFYSYRTLRSRTDFSKAISKTDAVPPPMTPDRVLAGKWCGRWKSLGVGDGGELKAIIWLDPATKRWHAQFLADHYAIFQTNQGMQFDAHPGEHDTWTFDGSVTLDEGVHHYWAVCDGRELTIKWDSALDHGNVTLCRQPQSQPDAISQIHSMLPESGSFEQSNLVR